MSSLMKYFSYLRRNAESEEVFLKWVDDWALQATDEDNVRFYMPSECW